MPNRRVKRQSVTQPLDTDYRFIPLTHNQVAIVDAADFEWLMQWNWLADWNDSTQSFYAVRSGPWLNAEWTKRGPKIRMHRVILNCQSKDDEGDHRNRHTLDNRRCNLVHSTHEQNMQNRNKQRNNTSGFIGVDFHKHSGKWRSRIKFNGRNISLGYFATPEEAARAYDISAKLFHKSTVNFKDT